MAARTGILLDTGPLVAYLAEDEQHHAWATEQFMQLDGKLITCEAVVSEAWFLLRRLPRHLARLRAMLADGVARVPRVAAYLQSSRRIPFNEQGIFRRYAELDG